MKRISIIKSLILFFSLFFALIFANNVFAANEKCPAIVGNTRYCSGTATTRCDASGVPGQKTCGTNEVTVPVGQDLNCNTCTLFSSSGSGAIGNAGQALYFGYGDNKATGTQNLYVTPNGNIAVGTSTAKNKLHIEGVDSGFAGIYLNNASPASTTNTLFNYNGKLRWENASFMTTTATATGATALGENTVAIGIDSSAFGRNSFASGLGATAFGLNTKAGGIYSFAIGSGTQATTKNSFALGENTVTGGKNAIAGGENTIANSVNSVSLGLGSQANGENSMAIGNNTTADSYADFVIGQYNTGRVGGGDNPALWDGLDPVFEIGIGASSTQKANALTVLKNGEVIFGGAINFGGILSTTWPGGGFGVASSGFAYYGGGYVGFGNNNPVAPLDVTGDLMLSGPNRYINFNTGTSSAGYGFRDNNGTMQFKNSNGTWLNLDGSSNGFVLALAPNSGLATSTSGLYIDFANTNTWTALQNFGDLKIAGSLKDLNNTAGTAGMVLQTTGNGIQWVATSSLGIVGGNSTPLTLAPNSGLATSTSGLYINFANTNTWVAKQNFNSIKADDLFDSTNSTGTSGMILQTTDTGARWVSTSSLGITGAEGGLTGIVSTKDGGTGNDWNQVATGSLPYFSASGTMSVLPIGSAGKVLTASSTGIPEWITPANNSVASNIDFASSSIGNDFYISTTTGLVTINLPTASASNRGLLSPADWTLFNDKLSSTTVFTASKILFNNAINGFIATNTQDAIEELSLKITGSGSSGNIATSSLAGQIPYYASAGTTALSTTSAIFISGNGVGIGTTTSINEALVLGGGLRLGDSGSNNPGTIVWDGVNFKGRNASSWITLGDANSIKDVATTTAGSDFTISTSSNTLTINMPSASAGSRGLLTADDWSIFNGKVATTTKIDTTLNSGLSGGGDLSADRSLALDIKNLNLTTNVDNQDDYVAIYSSSTNNHYKVSKANFLGGLVSGLNYRGTWDASINSPALATTSGSVGDFYVVSASGTQTLGYGAQDFRKGDFAIRDAGGWQLAQSSNDVNSVFGRVGAVIGELHDYSADLIDNAPYSTGNITATTTQGAVNQLADIIKAGLLLAGKINTSTIAGQIPYYATANTNELTATSKLFINPTTGNIGIGTVNPAHLLHLYSSTTNAEINIQSTGTPASNLYYWGIYQDALTQDLRFWHDGANNALTITKDGNLLVGTTTPNNLLTLAGTDGGSAGIYIGNAQPYATSSTLYNKDGGLYWGSILLAKSYNAATDGYGSHNWGDSGNTLGMFSIGMGHNPSAGGDFSMSIGSSTNSEGFNSFTAGEGTVAKSLDATSFGRYNLDLGGNQNSWLAANALFQIGNGTSDVSRADALTVMKNGKIVIGATSTSMALTLKEALTINGAMVLGGSIASPSATGTIAWNGDNFQGYNGSQWLKLDAGFGIDKGNSAYYMNNLSLGTSTASFNLDVFASTTDAIVRVNNTGAYQVGYRIDRNYQQKWFVGMDGASDAFIIKSSGTTDMLTLNPSIGVALTGTTTIDGNTTITGTTTVNGKMNINGNISATGCFGPVYTGKTTATTTGVISPSGYASISSKCSSQFGPGAHTCSEAEIYNSMSCGLSVNLTGWINGGYTESTSSPNIVNDCNGWNVNNTNSSTYAGKVWNGPYKKITKNSCSSPAQSVICCR